MKSTGIVRKLDEVGRFVLPKELRNSFGLKDDTDSLEIFIDSDKIVLKKYTPCCTFCGKTDDVIDYKGQKVCPKCIKKLASLIELVD